MLFTIDTNCVIDLERDTAFAPPLRELIAAHRRGEAEVAVPAVAASEVQRHGQYLENFGQFEERLAHAGLDGLRLIHPIGGWGWAVFEYEAASRTFRPGTTADKPPQENNAKCGFACHTIVKARDYVFTDYGAR